jgi:hypothetical protein
MDRHESKVRFEPDLYEALKKVADKRGVSFQVAIEEGLYIWMELDRRGARDVGTGIAAAALIMRDAIAAALKEKNPGRKLRALVRQLERWTAQLETTKAEQLAAAVPRPTADVPVDPALEYMAELLEERRPLNPLEQALADHVRRFAAAAHSERWGNPRAKTKAKA